MALFALACAFAAWNFSKWGLANSAASRAESVEVAEYLTRLAPDDPQTHYAAAVFLEKSFDPVDIEKALYRLEMAAGRSPNNYLLWLELGRARERSGDAEGAESALRRALALAPNYSRVQWALGNALLRQGRTDEAFAEIRKAVVGDPALADSAATAAWVFFDGDIEAIRRAMDGSTRFESALAGLLVREKRFAEALEIWDRLPAAEKRTSFKDTGATLLGKLLEAGRFRDAVRVAAEIGAGDVQAGTVSNGGFESAVKTEGAGVFEWQISAGIEPQIVLNGKVHHGGTNSLYFIFNSKDGKDFRTVSQTVAVEPGADHQLELFYGSDLKTSAQFKWEIVDAVDGKRLAVTDPIAVRAPEWTALRVGFKAPATGDGIVIRFIREGCGAVCAVNGTLWFDDISIR